MEQRTDNTKICLVCHAVFLRCSREAVKRFLQRKYCSSLCYHNDGYLRRHGVVRICQSCGKSFYTRPYKAKMETNRYCSCKCWTQSETARKMVSQASKMQRQTHPYVGENNPNWKGGVTPQTKLRLARYGWKLTAKWIKELHNTCERCGTAQHLIVHHIRPVIYGGSDAQDNLMVLCNSCHPTVEKEHVDKILENAISDYCTKRCIEMPEFCPVITCPLWQYRPLSKGDLRKPVILAIAFDLLAEFAAPDSAPVHSVAQNGLF